MSVTYAKGQRWMSEAEPELGLGIVLECDLRTVRLLFPSTGEMRMYSQDSAPVKRVQFQAGDRIETHEGNGFIVDRVENLEGIFHYHGGEESVPEMHLADVINLGTADRRLLDGRIDSTHLFDLRYHALSHQSRVHQHPAYGYMGARMDLIAHQLYIAQEVASRTVPRVLLADEVGLGKTIEACLILHRLYVHGRAGRVLILVPEPLIHQWFVELLRRFNLTCAIYDEERCANIQKEDENPFLEEHLILTSLDLFREHPNRLKEALAADWGMVIVDEAHHLQWTPEKPSWEYQAVEAFSKISKGLLLLTGTPEQFGEEGHFARLRLLDPDRFHDYQQFCKESASYQKTAEVVDKLILDAPIKARERQDVKQLFKGISQLELEVERLFSGKLNSKESKSVRDTLVQDLMDRYGTGRVVFRNTRSAISGFPKRSVCPVPLRVSNNVNDDMDYNELAAREMIHEFDPEDGTRESITPKDPRIDWLVKFLKKNKEEKVLLICRYKERAAAIHEAVLDKLNVKMATFHEELSLLQRDRNAAWFAEEDGARLLICSEIGSEGRNFQFAHHLVLFDLPVDPELLEQRIGRLDRIGQRQEIQLHVPYFKGTGAEVLFRWFHEGIDAFEHSVQGGALFLETFQEQVKALLLNPQASGAEDALNELIQETQEFRRDLNEKLEKGRDRLLELHSFQPEKVKPLIKKIQECDQSADLQEFMMDALDHFGVHVEELGERRWLLTKGHLLNDELTVIPDEGKMLTLDRAQALERDDLEFLTWDHPLVGSVMDLLLCSESGNASFAEVEVDDELDRGLLVEQVFILEGSCPPQFDIKQFLPTTPIRILNDQTSNPLSDAAVHALDASKKKDVPMHILTANLEVLKPLLQEAKETAQEQAHTQAEEIKRKALKAMRTHFDHELQRLDELRSRNGLVSKEELNALEEEKTALDEAIQSSQVRLDSIRLIRIV